MARVRSGGAARWRERAGNATEAYKTGVQNPRRDWATATAQAESTWTAAVQKAIADKRFSKGATKAGSQKQISRAIEVGSGRYVQGVASAEASYAQGVEPYLQVLENLNLPPRKERGNPSNLERVKMVVEALHNKKMKG
ncbi:MAG: hypothetical protein HC945_02665 [Nitrosarchaeum sp.]|nr:hypothetical protein [Nitrosarchaeum sp.]